MRLRMTRTAKCYHDFARCCPARSTPTMPLRYHYLALDDNYRVVMPLVPPPARAVRCSAAENSGAAIAKAFMSTLGCTGASAS